ncbi:hypothetical protein HPB51_016625 [Rhipicephalus microplus]|uniref:Uncharacterized protein n=1 Tax=Rhipicephalus microplus TaxID=6941 RepID=A0A9J6EI82_RHIMP|nr:hypothetical protein HPB51_016625 [Rhipicephalus microplus]
MKAYANETAHAVKTLRAAQELDLLLSCSFLPELFIGLDKKHIGAHLKTPEPDNQITSVYMDYTKDEIEVVNPLGAKRETHELLAVYCCVLNLHARYRSKHQSIYLVMLVHDVYAKTYGLTPVLQALLTDMKHLFDEGLTIELEDITTNVGVLLLRIAELDGPFAGSLDSQGVVVLGAAQEYSLPTGRAVRTGIPLRAYGVKNHKDRIRTGL